MTKIPGAIILLLIITLSIPRAGAQEYAGPLSFNPALKDAHRTVSARSAYKKTTHTLSLPFFEDFTGYSIYPDSSKWTDFEVFINNTMGYNPITRGVATFDALNYLGVPYDSFSNTNFRTADSLTSQPINMDLSTVVPGDSVYLSFFYQPQGNGFYPLYQDTLSLYFKTKYGGFLRVWAMTGSSLQPFQQVMIPISDSLFFHSDFQFRFVNIAALYWADAVWNVDYIRLDKNRNMYDTGVYDIGFAGDPTFLLNDYTSMPYRQFMANKGSETSAQYYNSIHNNWPVTQPVTYDFSATAINNGATLQPAVANTTSISANTIQNVSNTSYTSTIPLSSVAKNERVVFENKYWIESSGGTGSTGNDTIVKDVVFDNYLAYDDGSAEKSYYLNLYPTLPGKIAIEYHLNQPDTLRGMAIYFGRQIPYPGYKAFSIIVYSELASVNGAVADNVLLQQDLNSPMYVDTINHFTVYKFDEPLVLPAGTFYAGTMQAPNSGDDSIYFGLDVNRIGTNHAYYNVLHVWEPSLISGAIMMRPLLGQPVTGSGVHDIADDRQRWSVSPNPTRDIIRLEFDGNNKAPYRISDIQGRTVCEGTVASGKAIDISSLAPGMYFVQLTSDGMPMTPKKIMKL